MESRLNAGGDRAAAVAAGRSPHLLVATGGALPGAVGDAAGNRLLAALPPLDRATLVLQMEPVILQAGEVLVRQGRAIEHVWFPEGAVIAVALGGEHEVSAIGRDGMLGTSLVLGVAVAEYSGTVRVGGRALRLTSAALRDALAGVPALRRLLERHLHASLLHLARAVTCGREHLTVPRLAALLLWLRDQRGSDHLALTHEQVARLLGVSRRASVTEALRALKADGLVSARRGGLHVANSHGLQARACACYHAARGHYDRALLP